eukprot:Pompholyxophrys_punicea_v1_NODE_58_length_4147_cov_5.424487.p3 type:complete len:207 gc:universal NODE_58_length_4147_cov_5.424487:1694-2314(+)
MAQFELTQLRKDLANSSDRLLSTTTSFNAASLEDMQDEDNIKLLKKKITALKRIIANANDTIKIIEQQVTPSLFGMVQPPTLPANVTLPKLYVSTERNNVEVFLRSLEIVLSSFFIPSSFWAAYILRCMDVSDLASTEWVHLFLNKPGMSWEDAKKGLVEHFHAPNVADAYLDAFMAIVMLPTDSITSFSDRFLFFCASGIPFFKR